MSFTPVVSSHLVISVSSLILNTFGVYCLHKCTKGNRNQNILQKNLAVIEVKFFDRCNNHFWRKNWFWMNSFVRLSGGDKMGRNRSKTVEKQFIYVRPAPVRRGCSAISITFSFSVQVLSLSRVRCYHGRFRPSVPLRQAVIYKIIVEFPALQVFPIISLLNENWSSEISHIHTIKCNVMVGIESNCTSYLQVLKTLYDYLPWTLFHWTPHYRDYSIYLDIIEVNMMTLMFMSFMMITVDRFLSLLLAENYNKHITTERTKNFIMAVWIASLLPGEILWLIFDKIDQVRNWIVTRDG